jgi:hypothetical protein
MKNNKVKLVAAAMIFFTILSACSKSDSNTSPTSCNFGTNGAKIVTNPTLPWSITVTMPTGKPVNINAVGSAPAGGSLYLTYQVSYTNGIVSNTTGCGN